VGGHTHASRAPDYPPVSCGSNIRQYRRHRARAPQLGGRTPHAYAGVCRLRAVYDRLVLWVRDVLSQEHVALDPSRIAAQVVSGIGFLGAGTIVLRSKVVRGLTTAASLWTVAAVGLAVGGGLYIAAATATGLIVIILAGLKPIERRLFLARRQVPPLLILIIDRRETSLFAIEEVLEAANLHLQRMLIQHGDSPDENRLQITVNHTRNMSVLSVAEQLQRIPGVREIRHTIS